MPDIIQTIWEVNITDTSYEVDVVEGNIYEVELTTAAQGPPGTGLPTGGTTGQLLAKASNADGDTNWVTLGTASVDSVNGQIGIVVLDYDDVGAAPASHSHIEDDITDLGSYLEDAPSDGSTYGRLNGAWAAVAGGGAVDSVNSQTGAVVLDTDDIDEGAANLYYTEVRVAANTDVAANTAVRHSHLNKAQLDLVTDGDHDVRTDNPHAVGPVQIGAAPTVHTHAPSDLTQAGAATGQGLVFDGANWAPGDLAFHSPTDAVYVDPVAGDDLTGDGSVENPYATIQKGIDEASPGKVVIGLGSGDYAENVTCADGIDVVLPYSDLTLDDGDQLTLAHMRFLVRRLIRTSGPGAMVVASNTSGYAILTTYEITDDGSGDTIYSTNSAPLDISFSQAFIGNSSAFLVDDSVSRHVHLRGEDIYLTAANTTAVELTGGSTVLMTVHHTKELGAGVGSGRVFNIVNGDVNASFQEVGATTLADIAVDGDLNISAQQAAGSVTDNGVYTRFYNEVAGATRLGTNLSMFLEAAAYRMSGLTGNDGAFLALGANGLIVPTTLDVGAQSWVDDTEAFTDVTATTEETVYSVTVDQDFDAGSVSYELNITIPYFRASTVRLYHGATLLDEQTYTGASSPVEFNGSVVVDFSVTDGDEFTVTFETDVAPAFEPNRTDIVDGNLTVIKTGNQATPSWGSITGAIADQTDLMNEFLSKTNTDIYSPSSSYHPATKKYVDDNLLSGSITRLIYIEDPADTDEFPIFSVPVGSTINRVTFITDVGTVDFNLEERAEATPFTAGTDVFAADDQASSTHSVVTSFSNAGLAAHSWLWYVASAVASSPTKLIIKISYTED